MAKCLWPVSRWCWVDTSGCCDRSLRTLPPRLAKVWPHQKPQVCGKRALKYTRDSPTKRWTEQCVGVGATDQRALPVTLQSPDRGCRATRGCSYCKRNRTTLSLIAFWCSLHPSNDFDVYGYHACLDVVTSLGTVFAPVRWPFKGSPSAERSPVHRLMDKSILWRLFSGRFRRLHRRWSVLTDRRNISLRRCLSHAPDEKGSNCDPLQEGVRLSKENSLGWWDYCTV